MSNLNNNSLPSKSEGEPSKPIETPHTPDEISTEKTFTTEDESIVNPGVTPTIPDEVYQNLPTILKKCCDLMEPGRERDILLTGLLGVVSGCLPNVNGVYHRAVNYPNLYCIVSAPPSTKKGVLRYTIILCRAIHEYKKLKDTIIEDLKSTSTKVEQEATNVFPRTLIVPGNTSSAALMGMLMANSGCAIIVETEADSLANTLKQDWGNHSDILRKAFHFEPVTSGRKAKNEYNEIQEPKISLLLGGTPDQYYKLFPSAEDGLFSRLLPYSFETDIEWDDVSHKPGGLNLNLEFEKLSQKMLSIYQFLELNPTTMTLTQEQWNHLNSHFEYKLKEVKINYSSLAQSIVIRLGVKAFRICLIFSALRKVESRAKTHEIQCIDKDFETALQIADVYLIHSLHLFDQLPKNQASNCRLRDTFFANLPESFTKTQAVLIGASLEDPIAERTVGKYLQHLTKSGNLINQKTGYYRKTKYPPRRT